MFYLLAWGVAAGVGAWANSAAVAGSDAQLASKVFWLSIGLSLVVSFLGVGVLWLLARKGRAPEKLGLFYLMFIALSVVFFGDRGAVSCVVFAMQAFRNSIKFER